MVGKDGIPVCTDGIIFFCKSSDTLSVNLNFTGPDLCVFLTVFIVYSIILIVFYIRLKNNLYTQY